MSTGAHPAEADLESAFNWVLCGVVAGSMFLCPSDSGLDLQTADVLDLLGRQEGEKYPADIAACRTAFARMRDGTHAREGRVREQPLPTHGTATTMAT
jgi:hypothetical protein